MTSVRGSEGVLIAPGPYQRPSGGPPSESAEAPASSFA